MVKHSDQREGLMGIARRTTLLSAVLAGGALLAGPAQAAAYDAVSDFSVTSNPGSVWSYGYSNGVFPAYSLALFDKPTATATYLSWTDASYIVFGTPVAWLYLSGSAINGVLPGQMALHPGPLYRAYAILRFTAPSTAAYNVVGQFYAGDSGAMNGSVVHNSNLSTPLAYFSNTTDASTFSFSALHLVAGETLDLAVGNNGDYSSGSTPVTMTITTAVPEPATLALMLGGLGVVGWVAWRRKRA